MRVKLRGNPPHGYSHSSNQTTILRVRTVYIVKRNGQQQEMLLDKITSRIKKLCYGLDKKYVDPAAITLKVRLSGDHHVVKFCREAAPASPVRVHLSVVKSAAAVRSFMGHDMPICFICCVFVLRVGI